MHLVPYFTSSLPKKKNTPRIQDQDVYQLSDFILVSRSVKINKANYKFKYVTTMKHLQI